MLVSLLRRFLRDSSALGAVEFAFSAPFVVLLLLGGYETANYVRVSLRVEMAANSIAEMVSQLPSSSAAKLAGDAVIDFNHFHFFYDSTMYTVPDALVEGPATGNIWYTITNVVIWSVELVPTNQCGSYLCDFKPKLVWSSNGGPSCSDTINLGAYDTQITQTSLPDTLALTGSVIVVQVNYIYIPTFGAGIFGHSTITRTVAMQPRNTPIVESNDVSEGAGNCPNMPVNNKVVQE